MKISQYVFFLHESANHYRTAGNRMLALQRSESAVNVVRSSLSKTGGAGKTNLALCLFNLSNDRLAVGRRTQAKNCFLELKSFLEESESLQGHAPGRFSARVVLPAIG